MSAVMRDLKQQVQHVYHFGIGQEHGLDHVKCQNLKQSAAAVTDI